MGTTKARTAEDGVQDRLNTSEENDNHMKRYVEFVKVQDKALIGRMTNLVKIKDPCTGNIIAQIRDPKITISHYESMEGIIDIKEYIENRKQP